MLGSNLDLHQRAGGDAPEVIEALEPRLLLSGQAAGNPTPHGFTPIRWHGRDTYARTAQWIVKFDSIKGDAANQMRAIQDRLSRTGRNLHVRQQLGEDGLVLIKSPTKAKYKNLAGVLKKLRGFRYVEPNLYLHAALMPNDPSFQNQTGLHNTGQSGGKIDGDIDAPEAWDISTGSSNVVVGIVDSGIDYNHPDLAANIWVNPFEIAGDEIDNDGNGYIDDIHGWDFANDDRDPMDDNGHGTHVSGIVAAVGNNGLGVAGVSWSSKLMALKILDASGSGELSAAIAALNYATDMLERGVNIRVTNNSYGDSGFSAAFEDAVRENGEAGMLFVAAAGNGGSDGIGDNNDSSGYYPATSALPNVISVAATDHLDNKTIFSNFGATTVDIGAPGSNIWSTARGGGLVTLSGTSMASPHVAGVAALAFGISPRGADYAVVRDAIFAGGDLVSSMGGITATGRRLNAHGTLALLPLNPVWSDPANGSLVSIGLNDFRIGFSHPVSPASLDASDLTVNGRSADSVTLIDAKTALFHFDISPLQVQGEQSLSMAAGAVVREVDLAASGGYSATFRYDSNPMEVFHAELDQTDGLHLELIMDELVAANSVSADDLVVSLGTVAGVEVVAPDTVRFRLTGIDGEATIHYSLAAGAFLDRFTNPSLAHNGTLQLDFTTTALPAPLPMINPAGAMIRGTSATGLINTPGDSDAFTIALNAGQRLSLAVIGQDGLRPAFELLDPFGQAVDSGSMDGSIPRLDDVLINSSGIHTLVISDAEETEGRYALHAAVNANFESETFGGATNNDIATALDITTYFKALGSGSMAAIAAKSDLPAGALPNEVEPNDSLATSNPAARNFEPAPAQLYQMNIKGRVSEQSDDDYFAIGELQEEDILTINVSGVDGKRGTLFDPFLELYRLSESGPVRVLDDDDSGPVRDALVYRFEIPESGQYVVVARSWRDDSGTGTSGTYELALLLENIGAPPLLGGAAPVENEPNNSIDTAVAAQSSWRRVHYVSQTTGSIAGSDHDFSSYIFQQGDIVTVEVEATGSLQPRINLKRSSGTDAASDDGTSMLPGQRAGIFAYTIPSSGTYHLEIYRSGEAGSGSYSSRMYLSTSIAPQVPTPVADYYALQLEAGQQAAVVVNQNGMQPMTLQLQNSAGVTLASGTATGGDGSAQVAITNFIAPTGTYYIRTTGQRLEDYTLLVMRDAAFDLGDNDTSTAAQSLASTSNLLGYWQGGQEWYSIPMTAGQAIQLLALTPGGTSNAFDPTISIYDPGGAIVAGDDNGAGEGDARLIYKAAAPGVHRIAVNGDGAGEYLLNITRFWALPGTGGDDHYYINRDAGTGKMQIVRGSASGQPQYTVDAHDLGIVGIDGRGGSDQLTVDGVAVVAAEPSASTNLSITLRNAAQISLDGSPKLTRLTVEGSSWAALTGGTRVLRLSELQISDDSRLDLQDGALILQADAATREAMLQMLTDRIRAGRAGGSWSGNGIVTSVNIDRLHTIGISGNSNPSGGTIRASFLGQTVDANSILVKYGILGDADLDGDIDSDDYARIDGAYGSARDVTYADGDFDYSGDIDADDFFYIDRGFFAFNPGN